MKPYTKEERFAVVRRPPATRRYYANFRVLYSDLEDAEKEALRLSKEHKTAFYVIEILAVTPKIVPIKKKVVAETTTV